MTKVSSAEDCDLVARVYEAAMHALHAGETISPERRLVHDVEHMMQEINSGCSFEQWLRWASLDEIRNIERHLLELDLTGIAALVRDAIAIAFPGGLPNTEDEKSEATEWSPEQEAQLAELFAPLEAQNAQATDAMAAFARARRL